MKYVDKTCTIEGCERPLDARDLCRAHYGRWRNHGDPLAGGPMRVRRAIARRPTKPRPPRYCDLEGCGRKHIAGGLCQTHYNRKREGQPDWDRPIGSTDGRFPPGSGRVVDRKGYVLVRLPKDHPYLERTQTGRGLAAYLQEHRYVMAQHLGRALLPHENVHHVNGVKDDNRLSNLELWTTSQPKGQRVEDKVAWAVELLHLYAPHHLADNGEGLPLALSAEG